ncbi:MAG: hypothetical protein R2873_26495 [Caldilineaceae bacterium]
MAVVSNETGTGVRNPVQALTQIAARTAASFSPTQCRAWAATRCQSTPGMWTCWLRPRTRRWRWRPASASSP